MKKIDYSEELLKIDDKTIYKYTNEIRQKLSY